MAPAAVALLAYSTQILFVVCIATMGAAIFRLSLPVARLAYWQGIGALCLALPMLSMARPETQGTSAVVFGAVTITGVGGLPSASLLTTAGTAILWVWAGGALARLGWLVLGGLRLRLIRSRSTPATLAVEIETMRIAIAPRAQFRWTDELNQPVTFGDRHPVILLPRRFDSLSEEARRAVACHELLHVARRDWLWIVGEEHVRVLFWFHPAVSWVLEQVQLSREQMIDQLVVARTASRREYMNALLAFADVGRAVSPSMAFLRRRHLTSRLRQLSKESRMSWTRLVWTVAALVMVMAVATRSIVSALPLDVAALGLQSPSATRLEIRLADTEPTSGSTEAVVAGSGQRIYLFPTAVVTSADVTNARVIAARGSQFSVEVGFSDPGAARMATATKGHIGKPVAIVLNGRVIAAPVLRGPIGSSAVITGDFTKAQADEIAAGLAPAASSPPREARVNDVAVPSQALPVSSQDDGVVLPTVVRQVNPQYTQPAKEAKIQGDVKLSVVVLADGTVGDVTVTQSLDTEFGLDQQAVDATRLWQFKPGTKDGSPVAVRVEVLIRFALT